jgi:membrane-bound metal-dependent hydrolase YbcI (DUF457 family)
MSGIGHVAAGLAAKQSTHEVPLWLLLAASETNDLLYLLFSSAGIEPKASFTLDFVHGVRYVQPSINPWSHSLFMSIVWSTLAMLLAYVFYLNYRMAGVVGLVVLSHWILDFLMHSNLPLFFSKTPLLGLGLENSGVGFLFMTLLDLILLGIGILLYVRFRLLKPTTLK